ncbi:MAG: prolipoprotein diacylglyceryl transferase [Bacteroidales bacterium]|nr:prolipoprotein diacylglyceryl transferase [Bacteroidales bacterium]
MIAYIEWNAKPQIVDLGFIELRWYSLLFLSGFVVGYYILSKIFKKEGLSIDLLDKLTFYVVISTIIGARFGHCLFYEPDVYLRNPLKIILPFEGTPGVDFRFTGYQGLASHGGALGILIGLYLYTKRFKRPYIWILDRMAVVTAFAGTMIRIGNFFNSEIIGKPTDLPWGVKFVHLAYPGTPVEHVVTRHPAQIYEAICYLIFFVILILVYYKKYPKLKPGLLIGLFFSLMFTARFLIEFIKEDQVDFESNMKLNMGQWLSIPFIILGIYFIFRKEKSRQEQSA